MPDLSKLMVTIKPDEDMRVRLAEIREEVREAIKAYEKRTWETRLARAVRIHADYPDVGYDVDEISRLLLQANDGEQRIRDYFDRIRAMKGLDRRFGGVEPAKEIKGEWTGNRVDVARVYAWLDTWRAYVPAESVSQLQNILGLAPGPTKESNG